MVSFCCSVEEIPRRILLGKEASMRRGDMMDELTV